MPRSSISRVVLSHRKRQPPVAQDTTAPIRISVALDRRPAKDTHDAGSERRAITRALCAFRPSGIRSKSPLQRGSSAFRNDQHRFVLHTSRGLSPSRRVQARHHPTSSPSRDESPNNVRSAIAGILLFPSGDRSHHPRFISDSPVLPYNGSPNIAKDREVYQKSGGVNEAHNVRRSHAWEDCATAWLRFSTSAGHRASVHYRSRISRRRVEPTSSAGNRVRCRVHRVGLPSTHAIGWEARVQWVSPTTRRRGR